MIQGKKIYTIVSLNSMFNYVRKTLTPRQRRHRFFKRMGKVYTPTTAICFAIVYWFVGLRNAQVI